MSYWAGSGVVVVDIVKRRKDGKYIEKRHFRDNSYRFWHLVELRKHGREDNITVIWCSIWIPLVNIRIQRLMN